MCVLSVIIPVYNTINYLEECVESVINQTLDGIEIILIDDESPDGAGDLCDEIALKHKNVHVKHQKNAGLGLSRNAGLSIAQGKYIAFLDSDDFIDNDYYEKLVTSCDTFEAEICFPKGYYRYSGTKEKRIVVNELGLIEGPSIMKVAPRFIGSTFSTNDRLWSSASFGIYKHDFIKDMEFVSERDFISEDLLFNLRALSTATRIAFVDAIGYCYRYNPHSLSRGYRAARFNQLTSSVKVLSNECKLLGFNDCDERIAQYFWVNFEKCLNQEVRFIGGRIGRKNIIDMCSDTTVKQYLQILDDDEKFKGIHAYLCHLLREQRYSLIYIMLSLYNLIIHRPTASREHTSIQNVVR